MTFHLDSIENHVNEAETHVGSATQNLEQSRGLSSQLTFFDCHKQRFMIRLFQSAARRKKIILILILIVVLVVVGLVLFFTLRK